MLNCNGTIAYCITPHEGGTTTFYRNFAKGLRARGWRVFSVCTGAYAARIFDNRFGDESSVLLAPGETELTAQVRFFLEWLERERVDIVIPMCDLVAHASLPHLPPQVRAVTRCATITRMAYILSTLNLSRLSAVIATSQRQFSDLRDFYQVPQDKLRLIPHGIALERFLDETSFKGTSERLRLIYLGRLEDMDKGILLLPSILAEVKKLKVPFTCDIVGSGPDSERLRAKIKQHDLAGQVLLHGQKPPEEIPSLLAQSDIFLMPSRFEGFGFSLLEAMASGCVPIASHLAGVTDMIIEGGVSGFLCPVGKPKAFAQKIELLHRDRDHLAAMSTAARQRMLERFNLERMTNDYDAVLTEVLAHPLLDYIPRPLSQITFPRELRPTWRTRVPLPLKNLVRAALCRYFNRFDI